jgi:hypothetical protein
MGTTVRHNVGLPDGATIAKLAAWQFLATSGSLGITLEEEDVIRAGGLTIARAEQLGSILQTAANSLRDLEIESRVN